MASPQPGILAPIPPSGRFLTGSLVPGADPRPALRRLAGHRPGPASVIGLGAPLTEALGAAIPGLRPFPSLAGPGFAFPSTQGALWASVGGADAGDTLHALRALEALLGDGFVRTEEVVAFKHGGGRDLSGYEDGTENPKGKAAVAAAITRGAGPGLDGGSFCAAQRWIHDLGRLDAMTPGQRDRTIGRRRSDNQELASAPRSAHVKRTAQEGFTPPAFMVRRSMPFGGVGEHGLYFVAYGATLDPFEQVLRRMAGLDDGVTDALTRFTRAVSGGAYWCPPRLADGRLDLRALAPRR